MTVRMEHEQVEMGTLSALSNRDFRKSRAKLMRTKTALSGTKKSLQEMKATKLAPNIMNTVVMPEFRMITKRNCNSLLKQSSVLN